MPLTQGFVNLNVTVKEVEEGSFYHILNMNGQVQVEKTKLATTNTLVDLTPLPVEIYILQLQLMDGSLEIIKIVRQ